MIKNKTKVLHLISGGDSGGAKSHVISLVRELDKLIDVKIICFMEDIFYRDSLKAAIDIQVFAQEKRWDLSIIKRLAHEIEKEDYDLIHCHGARANFIGGFLKMKIDKPFITTVHSDYRLDFKDSFYKNLLYTPLNSLALRNFDYYIAISDPFKGILVQRGFKEDRIFTAYNGIDMASPIDPLPRQEFLKTYGIKGEGKFVIGIMGRLDKVKDHETYIRGAGKVLKNRKDLLFLIGGSGKEEKNLKAMVEKLNLSAYIHFLGFVEDQYSFFNSIDINSLTSISESFPYVLMEGARLKKPAISTKVGGIDKLIQDGLGGYLIDVGDPQALAEKILFLLDHQDLIKSMGENIYENLKSKFSAKNMAKRHLEIYENILKYWR